MGWRQCRPCSIDLCPVSGVQPHDHDFVLGGAPIWTRALGTGPPAPSRARTSIKAINSKLPNLQGAWPRHDNKRVCPVSVTGAIYADTFGSALTPFAGRHSPHAWALLSTGSLHARSILLLRFPSLTCRGSLPQTSSPHPRRENCILCLSNQENENEVKPSSK